MFICFTGLEHSWWESSQEGVFPKCGAIGRNVVKTGRFTRIFSLW
jgi:hypothetical protein